MTASHRALLAAVLTLSSVTAAGAQAPVWPDTVTSRLEALALVQTLNADLLSHNSATLTLDRWCAAHHLAADPHIVAKLVRGETKAPSAAQLARLGVGSADAVRYRRVRLTCGTRVLSEADNWYVPARLTPAMNTALETTDISFGRAVHPLHFQRHTLSAELLWHPLPPGWEMGAAMPSAGQWRAAHPAASAAASRGADPAGRHAVQPGCRDLYGEASWPSRRRDRRGLAPHLGVAAGPGRGVFQLRAQTDQRRLVAIAGGEHHADGKPVGSTGPAAATAPAGPSCCRAGCSRTRRTGAC